MPSATHEILISLFRDNPGLGLELLRQNADAGVPEDVTARETAAEFSDLHPPEYRADVALRLDRADGTAAAVLIVEVQLARDPDKRFSWPYYDASARARFRCPSAVLVIALDQAIARWCAEPVVLGPSGSTWLPIVLGPREIPRIHDEAAARAHPELAVLSAAAHANEPDSLDSVLAALSACEQLDNPRSTLYADLIFTRLSEPTLRALESLMEIRKHQYQSEFARRYFAEGREEGREEGLRTVLSRLLAQRFGELPPDVRQRIVQADLTDLEQWIERVIPARRLADVFADR